MGMRNGRVRLTIEFSKETDALLNDMARRMGGTRVDVLRKAVNMMHVALEAKEQGQRFGVIDEHGHLQTRIVGV